MHPLFLPPTYVYVCAFITCLIVVEVTQQQQDTQSSTSSQPTLTSSSDVTSTTVATGTQPATSSAGSLTANIDGVASATEGAHCEQRGLFLSNMHTYVHTYMHGCINIHMPIRTYMHA